MPPSPEIATTCTEPAAARPIAYEDGQLSDPSNQPSDAAMPTTAPIARAGPSASPDPSRATR